MKTAEHQILTRIGFAERWLQRAREECLAGDVARGLLTLVLADAEVRRLLQLAVAPVRQSRARLLPVVAMGAGLVMAAAVALQLGVLALGAAPVESAGLAPGLLLRAGTGALLEPIEAVAPQAPARITTAPAMPVPAEPARTTRRPMAQDARSSSPARSPQAPTPAVPAAHPVASPAPVAAPQSAAPAPAAAVVPPPPAALSGVDLLDLVIVADRTLRRSQP